MWLISYRYTPCFKYAGPHNIKSGEALDTIEATDKSPEAFLLDAITKGQEISEKDAMERSMAERFDKIEVIYFAREIDNRIGKQLQDNI